MLQGYALCYWRVHRDYVKCFARCSFNLSQKRRDISGKKRIGKCEIVILKISQNVSADY